ncbi:uncharacterized protein A4U43_C08F2250 [Asparagus officinalis]|nr:uncharacterized protein A4U43_C08F2250 [Asparagus officinalis]
MIFPDPKIPKKENTQISTAGIALNMKSNHKTYTTNGFECNDTNQIEYLSILSKLIRLFVEILFIHTKRTLHSSLQRTLACHYLLNQLSWLQHWPNKHSPEKK